MRTIFILFSFFCISLSASAQKADLPKKIDATFTKKYPKAQSVKWYVDKGTYIVKFKENDVKHRAEFDGYGDWKKTFINITIDELPEAVKAAVLKEKKHRTIDDIEKVVSDKKPYYRVDLLSETTKTKLWLDEKGAIYKTKESAVKK